MFIIICAIFYPIFHSFLQMGSAEKRLLQNPTSPSETAMVQYLPDAEEGVSNRPVLTRRAKRGVNHELIQEACQLSYGKYEEVRRLQDRILDAEAKVEVAGELTDTGCADILDAVEYEGTGVLVDNGEGKLVKVDREELNEEKIRNELHQQLHDTNEYYRRLNNSQKKDYENTDSNDYSNDNRRGQRMTLDQSMEIEREILAGEDKRVDIEAASMSTGGEKKPVNVDETKILEGDNRPIHGSKKSFEHIVHDKLDNGATNVSD